MNCFVSDRVRAANCNVLRIRGRGIGVHDGMSIRVAAKYDFDFLWLGSFGISASQGWPDVGLVGPDEVVRVIRSASRFTHLPIVVDLDSGHGDPVRLRYIVQDMALSGVAAVCIEDNTISKRSSLYADYERPLATIDEHVSRIRAAKIGAEGSECAVIARTEALVAQHGVNAAFERALAYVAAGADAVFVQCVRPETGELFAFLDKWGKRTPVFIAPTAFSDTPFSELLKRGATHVIYANQFVRAAHYAMCKTAEALSTGDGVITSPSVHLDTIAAVASTVGESEIRATEAEIA